MKQLNDLQRIERNQRDAIHYCTRLESEALVVMCGPSHNIIQWFYFESQKNKLVEIISKTGKLIGWSKEYIYTDTKGVKLKKRKRQKKIGKENLYIHRH